MSESDNMFSFTYDKPFLDKLGTSFFIYQVEIICVDTLWNQCFFESGGDTLNSVVTENTKDFGKCFADFDSNIIQYKRKQLKTRWDITEEKQKRGVVKL